MIEPFQTRFRQMIRRGASSQDIHDVALSHGYASVKENLSDAYVDREVARVDAHRRSLLPLLEHFVGPVGTILDIGCNTGGTTVALAMSAPLAAREVVGIDPNASALEAAVLRRDGHALDATRVRFEAIVAGQPLPFADASFDLVTLVSVLEFVSTPTARAALIREMERVTRPGGFIYVSTPSPWRLRELHSRRILGHLRRRAGYPWSSSARFIRRAFASSDALPTERFTLAAVLGRLGLGRLGPRLLPARLLAGWLPWQKHLMRRR
jgi:SAM-dependent methyltransferase